MRRILSIFALCLMTVAGLTAKPNSSRADGFAQSWAVSGWWYAGELGNTDTDPGPEILCVSKLDSHFGILDEVTGLVKQEFPGFTQSNSICLPGDWDGDGLTDLVFYSMLNVVPHVFKAYHWNTVAYVPFLMHSDSVATVFTETYRPSGGREFVEFSDGLDQGQCDLRLRDLSGQVLFKASTQVSGWNGPCRQATFVDRDHDGVKELLLEDQSKLRMFNQYNGAFTVNWTLTGWHQAVELGNLDADPQSEFLVVDNADGHYGIVDGLTGVLQQDFPANTIYDSYPGTQDLDGDGRLELTMLKRPNGQPPVYTIRRWNGATLAPTVTVTGVEEYSNFGIVQLRSTTQFEIVEIASTDMLLRDLSGTLLFRASTDLSGWSASPYTLTYHLVDADHFDMPDLILHDDATVRAIRFTGTFNQRWIVNGWQWLEEYGNADSDAQTELMLTRVSDGRFGLFDGATGGFEQDFPTFTVNNSQYFHLNTDGDPIDELFMGSTQGPPSQFTAFDWNGTTLAPLYSHTEAMGQWSPVQLRDDNQHEFLEFDNTDVRLRDLTGSVIWRASTDIPGWVGNQGPIAIPAGQYPDGLGVRAFYVIDNSQIRLVLKYNSTAVPSTPGAGALRVLQNSPNPFRSATTLRFALARTGPVGVRIFDAAGRLVRHLDRVLPAGPNELVWDGLDETGRPAANGVLFYEVAADGQRKTSRLVRMP